MLQNSLTLDLLDAVKIATDEARCQKGFKLGQNNFQFLSEKGKYIMNVFRHYNKINATILDIEKIEKFLCRFPNSKFYKENGINQLTYTQYHIEVFIHKVHTILEVKKLMVNEVYEFGVSEKDCSWDILKSKIQEENFKVYYVLNSYYKTFKQVIEARHLNTHRGIFNDSKKDDLDASLGIYETAEFIGSEVDDEIKKIIPKFILDWQVKNYRKDKLKLVIDSKKIIEEYAKVFFDNLSKEFNERRKMKTTHNK